MCNEWNAQFLLEFNKRTFDVEDFRELTPEEIMELEFEIQ